MTFPSLVWNTYLASFKQAVAWRVSMMLSLLTGPLFIVVNYFVWTSIFATSGQEVIRGFTESQMITYIIISVSTFYLLWDDTDDDIRKMVETGQMVTYLLKPMSYLTYKFIEKVGHRTLALVIEFIPVMFILMAIFGTEFLKEAHWLYYFFGVIIAFVMSFLLNAFVGLSAFWMTKSRGMIWIFAYITRFVNGSLLPLVMFPPAIQKVLLFLPFQFMTYVPTQLYLGRYTLGGLELTPWMAIAYGALYCLLFGALVVWMWNRAVRKFCGAGV